METTPGQLDRTSLLRDEREAWLVSLFPTTFGVLDGRLAIFTSTAPADRSVRPVERRAVAVRALLAAAACLPGCGSCAPIEAVPTTAGSVAAVLVGAVLLVVLLAAFSDQRGAK